MGIDWINTLSVSVSMAADCMTLGAVDGIEHPSLKKRKIFFTAFLFGLMQALMPVLGYFIGYRFKDALNAYIPWIAFALLSFLGLKNLIEWIRERKERKEIHKKEEEVRIQKEEKDLKIPEIFVQSVATSIDALCIGFVYLNYGIIEAMTVFGIIGGVTFVLSLIALFLGKKIGSFLVDWAGLIAAVVFFGIGLKILLEGILPSSGGVSSLFSVLFTAF